MSAPAAEVEVETKDYLTAGQSPTMDARTLVVSHSI